MTEPASARAVAGAVLALVVPPAWRRLHEHARLTPSPNSGWPIGAMALRLGVRLTKPGVCRLNPAAPTPHPLAHGVALLQSWTHVDTRDWLRESLRQLAARQLQPLERLSVHAASAPGQVASAGSGAREKR